MIKIISDIISKDDVELLKHSDFESNVLLHIRTCIEFKSEKCFEFLKKYVGTYSTNIQCLSMINNFKIDEIVEGKLDVGVLLNYIKDRCLQNLNLYNQINQRKIKGNIWSLYQYCDKITSCLLISSMKSDSNILRYHPDDEVLRIGLKKFTGEKVISDRDIKNAKVSILVDEGFEFSKVEDLHNYTLQELYDLGCKNFRNGIIADFIEESDSLPDWFLDFIDMKLFINYIYDNLNQYKNSEEIWNHIYKNKKTPQCTVGLVIGTDPITWTVVS